MIINSFKKNDWLFRSLFLFIVCLASYHIYILNSLSLWGDELWNLSKTSLDYVLLITPGFFKDPNYPTPILFFKLVSSILNTKSPSILVLANFINLLFIFYGIFILRNYFKRDQILLFLILIFSNEYFLRTFFEIKSSGLTLGLSSLFSCNLLLLYLSKGEEAFKAMCITGLILATIHPINGLFVCCSFALMMHYIPSVSKRIALAAGITFPIFFLFLYAFTQVDDFHIELNFKHIMNTGGFIIPTFLLALLVLYSQYKIRFKDLTKILYLLTPIILSLTIIFSYSFFIMPIYQARYFMTFLPLLCLILILFSKAEINLIKYPVVLLSIICIIFLYGPRSKVPYTNYEDLIKLSHSQECKGIPIFFNNSRTAINNYYSETYLLASKLYSKKFQRRLLSYDEIVASYPKGEVYSECKIIGISGQGKQNVFADQLQDDLNSSDKDSNYIVKKKLALGCKKPGCGLIWIVNKEANY